ncbi:glycosyltransferase family 9 protein [Flavobacteriaceae bacterium]|nr:glycosyltransferase family 9 protein [Flavobacteriaceae bacterium]
MPKNTKHILVIRLSAMGDVAMSVPVITTLLEKYPDVKITVLTKAFFATFFKDIPNVTVVVPDLKNKHKGFLGIRRLSKELKNLDIDVVADLHNVLRSNLLIRFLRISGVPYQQIDKGRSEKKALTSPKKSSRVNLKSTHERYADVFRKLGFNLDLNNVKLLPVKPIDSSISSKIGTLKNNVIGIAPFAAHKGKMYPLDKMEELIVILSKKEDTSILLFGGGAAEKTALDVLANKFDNVVNVTGRLAFEKELQLISNLSVMLSMDSGNGHLAAMYGVPVVTVWGVTHPAAGFAPIGQSKEMQLLPDLEKFPRIPTSIYGNKYPDGYLACFNTIAPKEIADSIKKCLNN